MGLWRSNSKIIEKTQNKMGKLKFKMVYFNLSLRRVLNTRRRMTEDDRNEWNASKVKQDRNIRAMNDFRRSTNRQQREMDAHCILIFFRMLSLVAGCLLRFSKMENSNFVRPARRSSFAWKSQKARAFNGNNSLFATRNHFLSLPTWMRRLITEWM